MELEELLDTQLQHFGVKGMKWGVRKSRTSKDRASETTPKPKSTVRKHIDSNKREVGMRKMLKDIDGLPDSEIQRRVNRVRNENDLRRAIDDTTFLDRKRKKALANPKSKESVKLAFGVTATLANADYADDSRKIYSTFKDKGYDAIPDTYDILTGTSQTAMIVINPDKLSVTSTTVITKDVMKSAKTYLKSVDKLTVSDLVK